MDLSNILYYIKTGVNDARNNSAMSISAVIIVIAGLCVFGIYSLVSVNISYIGEQLCNQYSITAYMEKGTPEDRAEEIREEIQAIDGVKSTEYVSEAQALEECREMFGNDSDFLDGLDEDNPLRSSIIITINSLSESSEVAKEAERVTDVAWVKDDSALANRLEDSTVAVRGGMLVLMTVFFAISLFIIANTIRITILAKQNDIHTMRYLGATNRFIIIPFVAEGIIIGIIGAFIAYITTIILYGYISSGFSGLMGDAVRIYRVGEVAIMLGAEYLLSGIMIGGLSSAFPLVKYMKV